MCYHGKQTVTIAKRFVRPRLESVLAKLWLVLDVKNSDCQLWGCTHFLLSQPQLRQKCLAQATLQYNCAF